MILKILIFSYLSSFGFQHLFIPFSPEEDILSKTEFTQIVENFLHKSFTSVILPYFDKNSFISVNYIKWIAGSKIEKVSIYNEKFKFLISFKYFDYGKFYYYEKPSEEPLLTYNPFAYSIGITPFLFFSEHFPFAISLFYNEERFLGYRTRNYTANLYIFINIFENLNFELSLNNAGTKPRYEREYIRIPVYLDVKNFIYIENYALNIRFLYKRGLWKSEEIYEGYWISVEKGIKDMFKIFCGFGKKDEIGNFGIGFDLKIKNLIHFTYSFRPSKEFEDINSFSLKIKF